jgi:transcriptional regulator with XRE-family HTH domain
MSWRQPGSPQHEELRRLLIERRRRAELTQKQVAERLGRPQRFVSRVERGLHRVTVVELIEFGQALEFDPAAALRRVAKAAKR